MTWQLTDDVAEFLGEAGDFLRSRPIENTLLLTAVDAVHTGGPLVHGQSTPVFGWWRGVEGTIGGVFIHTPPYPALLSNAASEVAALAQKLAAASRPLPGINADHEAAADFANEWLRRAGGSYRLHRRTRLYRLDGLRPPSPAPSGEARRAGPADRDLLIAWHRAFEHELGENNPTLVSRVDDRISYGGLMLWEVDDKPVSMAGMTRPISGMVRVAPVYTPPELRGRGYAAAATAAISQAALETGASAVVLFTDLANATSNALYQRLGYRPAEDRIVLTFSP